MFKQTYWAACAYTIAALGFSNPALAHVTLEQPNAEAGTYYKATLRVGHGCEGLPTAILRTKLAKPYDNHGKPVTEDVSDITWIKLAAMRGTKCPHQAHLPKT